MEDGVNSPDTTILSQSYIRGINRITGNRNTFEDEYKISEEVYRSRQKYWSSFFEKFSEVSDDLEYIWNLRPDTESNSSYVSEVRIPVRKSTTQVQYWVDTGNPPCRAADAAATEADEGDIDNRTFSISESEVQDFYEAQSSPSISMIVNEKVNENKMQSVVSGSSASSVDTTAYILSNSKAMRENKKDSRLLENNIVARCINAKVPRVLLVRCKEPLKGAQNSGNDFVSLSKSNDIHEAGKLPSSEIIEDLNIDEKRGESPEKESDDKKNHIKESEVTFESKESGIDSLAVEVQTNKVAGFETNNTKDSPASSQGDLSIFNKSLSRRKRKLFTKDDTLFDIFSPVVQKSVERLSIVSKCLHPALDSPSVVSQKIVRFRPKLLTLPGASSWARRSRHYSFNRKNRALLNKSKALRNFTVLQEGDKKEATDSSESNFPVENNNANAAGKSEEVVAPQAEKNPSESQKGSAESKSIDDSSSLSSCDISQIINEELERNPKTPLPVMQEKDKPIESPISDKKDSGNDQGSIFKRSENLSFESEKTKMENMLHVKKNLCATDLRSSGDTDSNSNASKNSAANSESDNISNATTTLLPHSWKLERMIPKSLKTDSIYNLNSNNRLNPVVVLHNFLELKDCCGKTERETNELWLRKQSKNENSEKAGDRKNSTNIKSKKEMDLEIPANKKLKMENRNLRSKRNTNISLLNNFGFDTDSSHSSVAKVNLRSRRINDDAITSSTNSDEILSRRMGNFRTRRKLKREVSPKKKLKSGKISSDTNSEKIFHFRGRRQGENSREKKESDVKIPVEKKSRLENKLCNKKMSFITTLGFDTDDSYSSVEKSQYLRSRKLNEDVQRCYSISKSKESSRNLENEGCCRVTFKNTNNQCEPIWYLSSSDDEENIVNQLFGKSNRRSLRTCNKLDKSEPAISEKNESGGTKVTETIKNSYRIVSSSSEDGEKIGKRISNAIGSLKVTREYSKRNKRKDSASKSVTTMCLEEKEKDKCDNGSEDLKIENKNIKKLDNRLEVVKRRSERKRDKQTSEMLRDDLLPGKKTNEEILTGRKSTETKKLRRSGKNLEAVIHDKIVLDGKKSEQVFDHLKTPVVRLSDLSKNIKISSQPNARRVFSDDEQSSDFDNAINFNRKKNCAGDNSLRKSNRSMYRRGGGKDVVKIWTIGSHENSSCPSNRGIDKSAKKIIKDKRNSNSKLIFQTKEIDSDNS